MTAAAATADERLVVWLRDEQIDECRPEGGRHEQADSEHFVHRRRSTDVDERDRLLGIPVGVAFYTGQRRAV
jgi:hypothetical protein